MRNLRDAITAIVKDVQEHDVLIHSGVEYLFPKSYFPKDIRIGDSVFMDEKTGCFRKINEYESLIK